MIRVYLRYTEDTSKLTRKALFIEEKNQSKWYIMRILTTQKGAWSGSTNCTCPYVQKDHPDGVFYLKPLNNPENHCWFCKVPNSHNMLQQMMSNLLKAARIESHFTNHSLRATSATRLFEALINEQLIMQRIRHTSLAVWALTHWRTSWYSNT